MTQDTETTEGTEERAAEEEGEETASAQADERAALQAELEEARSALEKELATRERLETDLATALESCRMALLASAPELPAELVQGGTVAELEAAFSRAKALADRVRQQVESEAAQERVPRGLRPGAAWTPRRSPRSRRSSGAAPATAGVGCRHQRLPSG